MIFSVKIDLKKDGCYHAVCPELGLRISDTNSAVAVDKIKTLLVEWLCNGFEPSATKNPFEFLVQESQDLEYAWLNANGEIYLLYVPNNSIRQ